MFTGDGYDRPVHPTDTFAVPVGDDGRLLAGLLAKEAAGFNAVYAGYAGRLYDYAVWREAGGDPVVSGLRRAYVESCDTLGRRVRVELPGRPPLMGEAVDIDLDGRLVVDPDIGGQPVPVAAGDVLYARPA